MSSANDPIIPNSDEWLPSERAQEFNPDRFDFRWNAGGTAFRLIPLRWWDNESYIAYQSDCLSEQDYAREQAEAMAETRLLNDEET